MKSRIPYGSKIGIKCSNCWYKGRADYRRRWNTILEVCLWLLFIIPGLIYTLWRFMNKICICPKCKIDDVSEINDDIDIIKKLNILNVLWNISFFMAIVLSCWVFIVSSNTFKKFIDDEDLNSKPPTRIQTPTVGSLQGQSETQATVTVDNRSPEDKFRDTIQTEVDKITHKYSEDYYSKTDLFDKAYCEWDCINWRINIDFKEPLSRYEFTLTDTIKKHTSDIYEATKDIIDTPIIVTINFNGVMERRCRIWHNQEMKCIFNTKEKIISAMKVGVDEVIQKYRDDPYQKIENFDNAYCVWDCYDRIMNIDFVAYPYWAPFDNIVVGIATTALRRIIPRITPYAEWLTVTVKLNIAWEQFVSCTATSLNDISCQ